MSFINPKIDFAFKKIFGSPESKNILISFLNALLYQGEAIIKDLEIIDPYLAAQIFGVKDSYLDVRATLDHNSTVIIEMQVINVQAFGKRVLYNAAKTYSLQLTRGKLYQRLQPVIALSITDFQMFENHPEVISRFVFKEEKYLFTYPQNQIELVFVELPKFNKNLAEVETITDKWVYFLKNTADLETIPEKMGIVPEIQSAFNIANDTNLTLEEFNELQRQEFYIQDQQGAVEFAVNQAVNHATKQTQISLIMRLLRRKIGTIETEIETRISQLSIEQLENLGDAVLDFITTQDLNTWLDTYSR